MEQYILMHGSENVGVADVPWKPEIGRQVRNWRNEEVWPWEIVGINDNVLKVIPKLFENTITPHDRPPRR